MQYNRKEEISVMCCSTYLRSTSSTSFSGVDTEALVPEATDQDVAVVGGNHKTVRVYLDALVHQVGDLTLAYARVVC